MGDAKPRILVVDDEPSIAKIVRKQLEVAGYEVIVGVDGQEGLTKAQTEHPDLVVLDVMLPKLNGYQVCGQLKQDEQLKRIPILMLTAKAQRRDEQEGLQQGADAFLTKPFRLEDLLERIRTLLKAKAAAPETQAPLPPAQPQPGAGAPAAS